MTWAMRINQHHLEVGYIKWEIVVATIPEDYIAAIGVVFSLAENGFKIYAGVDNVTANNMGLVLLHLFYGALVFLQI